MAVTARALSVSLTKFNIGIKGSIIDATVIKATVDDPCEDLRAAPKMKGRKIPIL